MKVLQSKHHPCRDIVSDPWCIAGSVIQEFVDQLGGQISKQSPWSKIPLWRFSSVNIDICLANRIDKMVSPVVNKSISLEHMSLWSDCVSIYTDGSKVDSKTGYGIFIPELEYSEYARIENDTSIFIAELVAINKALILVKQKGLSKVVIFSDSLSGLMVIKSESSNSYPELIYEIWYKLNELTQVEFNISLVWIPAHIGIYGNEQADQLAKSSLHIPEINVFVKKTANDFKMYLKVYMLNKWQSDWDSCPTGYHYKCIHPTVSLKGFGNHF